MSWLFVLIPVAVIAAIIWAIVALTRRAAGEPFTLATAVSGYAHLLIVVGTVLATAGGATLLKAGIGYARIEFAYEGYPQYLPGSAAGWDAPSAQRHSRGEDLVLGATLLFVGGLVSGAHLGIARVARRLPAGRPAWATRGAPLLLAVVAALIAVSAAATGIYDVLRYVFVEPLGSNSRAPFAEPIGYALAFLPFWLLTLLWLVRTARQAEHPAPEAGAAV